MGTHQIGNLASVIEGGLSSLLHGPMLALVIIAVVVYVVIRKLMPKKVDRGDILVLPILAGYKAFTGLPKDMTILMNTELFLVCIVSIVIGVWQGISTQVYSKQGILYSKSGPSYIIAWICYLAARVLIKLIFEGSLTGGGDWLTWAGIALSSGAMSGMLYLRYPEIGKVIARGGKRE
ncbi:hypothetical protein [Paenibacillus elgii]|nr:hypothetical protein [Paenibacillus elgii]